MEQIESRIKAYRLVAYSAIAFAGVAVLIVGVTLPLVYTYVHNVRSNMHKQADFCKVSSLYIFSPCRPRSRASGTR